VEVLEDTHPLTGIGGDVGKPNFLTPTAFATGFVHLVGQSNFPDDSNNVLQRLICFASPV
jgi:hypothetical protein